MSYSSQTKEELCRFEPDSVCCLLAELSGIVCAAGSVIYRGGGDKRLSIETENNAVARRAFRLLREVFDVQPQLVTLKRSRLGGRSAYRIEISGSEASFVLEGCGETLRFAVRVIPAPCGFPGDVAYEPDGFRVLASDHEALLARAFAEDAKRG